MDESNEGVVVPNLPPFLTPVQESTLREELENHQDDNFNVEHYILARSYISHIMDNCTH